MLPKHVYSLVNLNALAKLVSNAGLKRIMFDDNYDKHGVHMKCLLAKNGICLEEKCTIKNIIDNSYSQLLKHYRHEYLYKTALLNNYVLKQYSLADTILLNEFKIGKSIADTVLVNGTNKVFEIKTELDSPERLNTQINDYYKAFSEVYVVVYHTHVKKYMQLLENEIGIMEFRDNIIEVRREAVPNQSRLDVSVMIKSLRKDEYLQVVKLLSGELPNVQPVLLFKTCLNILLQFSTDMVQVEFLKTIKNRINPVVNKLILEPNLPESIRHSIYHSNISENIYNSIINRLNLQV